MTGLLCVEVPQWLSENVKHKENGWTNNLLPHADKLFSDVSNFPKVGK